MRTGRGSIFGRGAGSTGALMALTRGGGSGIVGVGGGGLFTAGAARNTSADSCVSDVICGGSVPGIAMASRARRNSTTIAARTDCDRNFPSGRREKHPGEFPSPRLRRRTILACLRACNAPAARGNGSLGSASADCRFSAAAGKAPAGLRNRLGFIQGVWARGCRSARACSLILGRSGATVCFPLILSCARACLRFDPAIGHRQRCSHLRPALRLLEG